MHNKPYTDRLRLTLGSELQLVHSSEKKCTVNRDILNKDKLQEASMLPETF
jgi:hypothetical protein